MSKPYVQTRESPIHGRGVFAIRRIPAGARLIEYKGARRNWTDYEDSHENYAFLFDVGNGKVIDPFDGGNDARFVNHSCAPNCEARLVRGRIYLEALRDIQPEEEILYDYCLTLERPPTSAEKRRYPCRCGAPNCRKTLFAAG
jgi:uncharacterized protein